MSSIRCVEYAGVIQKIVGDFVNALVSVALWDIVAGWRAPLGSTADKECGVVVRHDQCCSPDGLSEFQPEEIVDLVAP